MSVAGVPKFLTRLGLEVHKRERHGCGNLVTSLLLLLLMLLLLRESVEKIDGTQGGCQSAMQE